jgi:putative DNA primase/helicase
MEPEPPTELMARPQWVAWRIESRDGRPTKVPYSPITGGLASTSNPQTWGTYEQARSFCEVQGMEGVGYVFSAEDPYTGIDLDKCRDPETGAIEEWAQEIITALRSYTEISPSGRGVHIIIRGKLPPEGRRKEGLEMYDRGRLEGTLSSIEDRQAELEALHRKVWPGLYKPRANEAPRAPTATERLTDEEVLGKALGAKNGEKFARLWMGDTSDYDDDDSRADLALCRMLAFWTQDPEQIDRLFRQSGLMRWKWDRPYANGQTYGERTIEKVLAFPQRAYMSREVTEGR